MKNIRGEKTDWVGKKLTDQFFLQGKYGPARFFPKEKTDWGEISACFTGIKHTCDISRSCAFLYDLPTRQQKLLICNSDFAKSRNLLFTTGSMYRFFTGFPQQESLSIDWVV